MILAISGQPGLLGARCGSAAGGFVFADRVRDACHRAAGLNDCVLASTQQCYRGVASC